MSLPVGIVPKQMARFDRYTTYHTHLNLVLITILKKGMCTVICKYPSFDESLYINLGAFILKESLCCFQFINHTSSCSFFLWFKKLIDKCLPFDFLVSCSNTSCNVYSVGTLGQVKSGQHIASFLDDYSLAGKIGAQ